MFIKQCFSKHFQFCYITLSSTTTCEKSILGFLIPLISTEQSRGGLSPSALRHLAELSEPELSYQRAWILSRTHSSVLILRAFLQNGMSCLFFKEELAFTTEVCMET